MAKKKVVKVERRPAYEVSISEPKVTIQATGHYSMQYINMSIEEAEEVLEMLRKALCEVPR